jgi:hydroxypyruvate isomerase
LNRKENHSRIEEELLKNIELAAKYEIPSLIVFSGNRRGISDEEGIDNTVEGLLRVVKAAEEKGVTLCLELLNSKYDHKDYQCDRTWWGVEVCKRVNSPRVKLLYDIYHMQIMEGDLINTIRQNIKFIGHFHTAGVPGRRDIDEEQEINYRAVMRAIAETGYDGYVGHEFVPKGDPIEALKKAFEICNV